jgi:hypothetical protein
MTTNYSDIEQHVTDGKTAAEIAAILAADTRHVRDVMATSSDPNDTDLLDVMGEFGLIGIGDSGGWEGPLVNAILAAGSPVLNEGWQRLKMNLQVTNRPVRCGSNADIGSLVTALTGLAMQAMQAKAVAIKAEMDRLTGGLRFAGVTEADVQALIDAETQRVADAADALAAQAAAEALETQRMELWQTWQALYNTHVSPVLDGTDPTVANLDAGIVAALAALRGE